MAKLRLLVVVRLLVGFTVAHGVSAEKPNVIVVIGGDHGQWALGVYGLGQIDTPNHDWLADRGVLFNNAIFPAPVCSRTRANFYTGTMPSRSRVRV